MSVLKYIVYASSLALASTVPAGTARAEPTMDFSGRLQIDYAFYDDDVAELDSGGEFRRARLAAKGDLSDNWEYKLELDFADGDTEIKDAYVAFGGLPEGKLYIGNQKVPQSLEEQTSALLITFMERSLPNAFFVGRRLGVNYQHHANLFGIQLMAFGEEPNDSTGGHGVGGRAYFLPVRSDDLRVHLAASAVWEDPEDGGVSQVRYRARPESHVTDTRLINTGTISDVDSQLVTGLEAAASFGSITLQSEWLSADASRNIEPDYDFSGYYLQASWIITGESRPYNKGKFDRIQPSGSYGAWEVALRASHLDLNDRDIFGGREDNLSLALNWYPLSHLRFSANYIQVDADLPAGSDDPDIFQVRAQYDF